MKYGIPILLTLVLTACGGGGGGGSSTTSNPTSAMTSVMSLGAHTNTVYNIAVADLNGDGLDDAVISGWNRDVATAYVYIFIQNSNGTLTDKTSTLLPNNIIKGSQRVLIADFDNDGHTDIFVPGFDDGVQLYSENSVMLWGTGAQFTRQDWTDTSTAHGACIGDVNNDGKTDLLVAGSGVFVNQGNRNFQLNTTMLQNNYFSACAVIKEASSNTIYLANNQTVNGYRDAMVSYDFALNMNSSVGYQADNSYDTIDVVTSDLTGDGHLDFVLSLNGINVPDSGPREIVAYTAPSTYTYSSTLESARSSYYGRSLTIGGIASVFFSGDTNNASVYRGTTKYKAGDFVAMAGNNNDFNPAEVYQNFSNGKIYMLQLINGTFYTEEMQ